MDPNETNPLPAFIRVLHFAAAKHRDQRRKDPIASPYINHPIAVAEVLARIGGVTDPITIAAAILHDTVEDTETTLVELESLFGPEVRAVVAEVTDDKSLPKRERKRLQVEQAPGASERAKLVKLADKICNVRDVIHHPPPGWPLERRREYLDWSEKVAAGCRGVNEALERELDAALQEGRRALGVP
ncbi:MAG TPA: HD domain-containing protein [Thermoanaerobaculia bacterium]|nr:HD domain-containing protein [Thermoanaerobaculia bacterium]